MASVIAPEPATRDTSAPAIVPVDSMPEPALRDLVRGVVQNARNIWVAWSMLALCLVLSGAMLAGAIALAIVDGFRPDLILFIILVPGFLPSVVVGMLILQRYPNHRVGWLLSVAGTIWIVSHAVILYGVYSIQHLDGGLPADREMIQAGSFYPLGYSLLLIELLLVFPGGRVTSRGWQTVRVLGVIAAVASSVSFAFGSPLVLGGELGAIPNPWRVDGPIGEVMHLAGVGYLVIFALGIAAALSVFLRLHRASGVERLQMRWIAWDTLVLAFACVTHLAGAAHVGGADWQWFLYTLCGLAMTSFAVILGLAILRFRLYSIDVVIHRSIISAGFIAIIAVVYLALVTLMQVSAQRFGMREPEPWVASVLVAGGVALLVLPIHRWMLAHVSRRLYGSRDTPDDILTRLGLRLESAITPADVLHDVCRTATELLRLPHAAIATSSGAAMRLVAESGVPGPVQVSIPMIYQHEQIGELRVTPRGPGEGFSQSDREVLESIARQTAVAAFGLRVSGDLQLARERLVTAREEERRRLRRDLHDGLGAQLAALTMQAGAVKRLVRAEPERAVDELDHLQTELRSAITDIRRLVHGLRPPALDEFGLITALRSRLLAFERGSATMSIELGASGDDGSLPAAIEVAVYRIVEEALTNIIRHAAARSVTMTLMIDEEVRLEIMDDGKGIPEGYRPGVGFQSMRERTEELGGALTLGALDGGGTRTTVTIPLPPEGRG